MNTKLLTSILQKSIPINYSRFLDYFPSEIPPYCIQTGGFKSKTEKVPPLTFASILYDVMNDILVDVTLHSYRHNERKSTKSHMDFCQDFQTASYFLTYLNSKGILFLMRVPKTFKKAMAEQKDSLFTYRSSRNKEPPTLKSVLFYWKMEAPNIW